MDYYRKTAAIFIIIMTLLLPLFLEKADFTGVVEVERVYEESSYINKLVDKKLNSADKISAEERKSLEGEVTALIKEAAEDAVQDKNYSAIIFKTPLYKGGEDITDNIIKNIDQKYN
jgi:Skp family chaperone for outer membrane proteins